MIRNEFGHKVLYTANVGDSRAVVVSNGAAKRMTVDHRPSEQSEIDRVKAAGGKIFNGRLCGSLAITRAMGDHQFKNDGLSATPSVNKYALRPFDKYLLVASDGIWDFISEDLVASHCKDDLTTKQIAKNIIKAAIDSMGQDNISIIVVRI